jgi:hypothetical protein
VPATTLAKGLAAEGPAAAAGTLRVLRADCNPMGDAGREAVLQAAQRRTMLKYSLRTGSSFTDPRQLLASTQVGAHGYAMMMHSLCKGRTEHVWPWFCMHHNVVL